VAVRVNRAEIDQVRIPFQEAALKLLAECSTGNSAEAVRANRAVVRIKKQFRKLSVCCSSLSSAVNRAVVSSCKQCWSRSRSEFPSKPFRKQRLWCSAVSCARNRTVSSAK
jgi:hypothetical protein